MDYKALVARARHNVSVHGGSTVTDVLALCDAVEALEKDREATRERERVAFTVGWDSAMKELVARGKHVGSVMDTGPDRDAVFALCDAIERLENIRTAAVTHTASAPTPTASTPTPAAPSDA